MQESIKKLWEKFLENKSRIQTEESTKNAFIMPFIQILWYNVFDPSEVVPEFTADVWIKKWEKVDYCIMKWGKPIILVECKQRSQDLNNHSSQLFRYFHVTKARFAILTNWYEYKFFSDLEEPNKMDQNPFLVIDITDESTYKDKSLDKFIKENFDEKAVISSASMMKLKGKIHSYLSDQFYGADDDFVKFIWSKIYNGRMTAKAIDEIRPIITKSWKSLVNTIVTKTLEEKISKIEIEKKIDIIEDEDDKGIETTLEELEGFFAIKSMCKGKIDLSRITHRDTKSYFGILVDDNNRKIVCRLHFNGSRKCLWILNDDKSETKFDLDGIDDLYKYWSKIKKRIEFLLIESS